MRIILSRKGFDAGAGGCPSPILPDGRLVSLPIPDHHTRSDVRYADVRLDETMSYFDLMRSLFPRIKVDGGWKALTRNTRCHLDPDLARDSLARSGEWVPALGQIDQAQRHLENNDVGRGDLFLFFGWFRETEGSEGALRFAKRDQGRLSSSGTLKSTRW